MHRKRITKRISAMLTAISVLTAAVPALTGCGRETSTYSYSNTTVHKESDSGKEQSSDGDIQLSDKGSLSYDEYHQDKDYQYEDSATAEKTENGSATYPTENRMTGTQKVDYAPVEISVENFCDSSAIEYARENNCNDHLLWLADHVVNCIEPQAVAKLLQIPVLSEAAHNGEISRYISVYLTYNDENQFGAMQQSCYLGRDGHGVEDWDSPFYSVGHNVLINLGSFPYDEKDDPSTMQFLQSAMIHEMMHAFMTDYLFNLSLGTGRDGARLLEKDSKGNFVMDEYDRPVHIDEIPTWFQEGLAMVVENPYGTRAGELMDLFDPDATEDEYLEILSDPQYVYDYLNVEFEDIGLINIAKISNEENTYTTGWIATLFLCAMAGEKLGYDVFDENGFLNNDAVFYGLNELLTSIHDGHSLDYVIADISFDYNSGKCAYKDTSDFEEKCFGSIDDPGLLFMQKLMFDLESRSADNSEEYIPSGSILPDYVNGVQFCMDDYYHEPAIVYEVDNIDAKNPYGEYFSISTIRMSNIALTGGRRTSYDPILNPLSAKEATERDYRYIGDKKEYIDLSLEED